MNMHAIEPDQPRPPAASAAKAWMRALEMTARIDASPARTLPVVIDELAERFGEAPALLSDNENFSFRQLAERAHRYSRWALSQGLQPGEAVALMMVNRPEYMAIWLGLGSVGVVTALLNTHLSGASLAHAVAVAAPKAVIVDAGHAAALAEALERSASTPTIWLHGEAAGRRPRIDLAVEALSAAPLTEAERPAVTLSDRALMIYTSGTTGLPKAAHVSHHRVMMWSHWFAGMTDARADDRLYNCLPMYHSVGGVVATGSVLIAGGSVVLRERFSASRFWTDIARWDCTLVQYIGELCRYLMAAPPTPEETTHRLRVVCGNGLRPDIWTAFQDRFHIPRILEFYAATEGNFSLYNAEGHPGAIGRIPSFLAHRFPAAIVRFDPATGAPARGEDGFCIRCPRGDVGEAIGRIAADPNNLSARFEGYTDPADSEKKVLRDVFAPGDAWLRTGDLMRMDDKGFYYFVDRIGDTFRWKGENVATTEVSEAICAYPSVQAANVYGVSVPGADGRAGMAALVVDQDFDLAGLRAHLAGRLPDYARPLFLRIVDDLAATETFKQKKQDLVEDGFDPSRIADPLYFNDASSGAYLRLDDALFGAIIGGRMRL
jgi:fatty-acyl-CoA synthase